MGGPSKGITIAALSLIGEKSEKYLTAEGSSRLEKTTTRSILASAILALNLVILSRNSASGILGQFPSTLSSIVTSFLWANESHYGQVIRSPVGPEHMESPVTDNRALTGTRDSRTICSPDYDARPGVSRRVWPDVRPAHSSPWNCSRPGWAGWCQDGQTVPQCSHLSVPARHTGSSMA